MGRGADEERGGERGRAGRARFRGPGSTRLWSDSPWAHWEPAAPPAPYGPRPLPHKPNPERETVDSQDGPRRRHPGPEPPREKFLWVRPGGVGGGWEGQPRKFDGVREGGAAFGEVRRHPSTHPSSRVAAAAGPGRTRGALADSGKTWRAGPGETSVPGSADGHPRLL